MIASHPRDSHWNIAIVALFVAALAACLYKPLTRFYVLDPEPTVTPYNQSASIKKVDVGLHIKNFAKFDVAHNLFVIDASLWFLFDPKDVDEKKLLEYNFESAEIEHKSAQTTLASGAKKIIWYDLRIKFSTNLNYHFFPVDDHVISLVLQNKALIDSDIHLVARNDDFQLPEDIHLSGWELEKKKVASGFGQQKIVLDKQERFINIPRVVFSIDLSCTGIRHLIVIFLPLLLIYCIALMSLILNIDTQQEKVIDIVSASLAGLIGYRFVLDKLSPSVDYFMISDYIYLIFLFALFILFILVLLHDRISSTTRTVLLVVLHIAIIALWYYFFAVWLVKTTHG